VKEKFLMKRNNERLNVATCGKRSEQPEGGRLWSSADMRRLAELARGFILPFFMGVALSLGAEHDEQDHQGKRQHPDPGVLRFVRAVHFDSYTIAGSSFDVRSTRR
jgi:hypothetical protein